MIRSIKKHGSILVLGLLTAATYAPKLSYMVYSLMLSWACSACALILTGFNVKNRQFDAEMICFSSVSLILFLLLSIATEFPEILK